MQLRRWSNAGRSANGQMCSLNPVFTLMRRNRLNDPKRDFLPIERPERRLSDRNNVAAAEFNGPRGRIPIAAFLEGVCCPREYERNVEEFAACFR